MHSKRLIEEIFYSVVLNGLNLFTVLVIIGNIYFEEVTAISS